MNTRTRTALFALTLFVSAASALVAPLTAAAAERDGTADARARHVAHMASIGLTPRFDALPAPAVASSADAVHPAARQSAWAESQRLAGRTLRFDERAPAPFGAPRAPETRDEAWAAHAARAEAAGRTVQWHEAHAFGGAGADVTATGGTGGYTAR